MRRHIAEPLDPGGLQANVWVEAPGYRTLDDSLSLLLQQVDEPLLSVEVAMDAFGGLVEEAGDGGLFERWRY
jgi:hypothetical protein